jgi:hypothetical protein
MADYANDVLFVAQAATRRLVASQQAINAYVDLQKKGQLGRYMILPRPQVHTGDKRGRYPVKRGHGPKPDGVQGAPPEEIGIAGAVDEVIVNAVAEGITRIWDGSDKARTRALSLQKQAAPLAMRPREKPLQEHAPTVERRRKIETALETYAQNVRAGRDLASEAWRVVPVIEGMRERDQLTQHDTDAAERFYRDFILGHRVAGLTAKYGEQMGKGGTPLAQMAGEVLTPDEMRTHFHQKFVDACKAINHWPTIEWLVLIVCEQLIPGATKPPTLAEAGRVYMGYKDPKQQQASGATLIKTGLQRLARHYGLVDERQGRRGIDAVHANQR